jgi:hypothetical protein
MTLKLHIKTPGYFIDVPGMASFRTPANVDVTTVGLNLIVSELKKLGIENYSIDSASDNKPITKEKVNKISKEIDTDIYEKFVIDKTIEVKSDLSSINKRFNVIEDLLKNIINVQPGQTKKIKKIIDEDNGFIPSMNIDDLKIKGRSTFKTKKSNRNIQEDSDNLAEMIKK